MIYDLTNVAPSTLIKDVERGLTLELVTQIDTSTGELTKANSDDHRLTTTLKYARIEPTHLDARSRPSLLNCHGLLSESVDL